MFVEISIRLVIGGDIKLGTIIFYFLLAYAGIMIRRYIRYRGSTYKIASGYSFFKTVLNKGSYGEFLTFSYLDRLGGHHKLMTNLYLPKVDGSTIMLSEAGIYVFESKNYSG